MFSTASALIKRRLQGRSATFGLLHHLIHHHLHVFHTDHAVAVGIHHRHIHLHAFSVFHGHAWELVISRTPFIVVYRVKAKRIELLRVLHGSQQWPKTPL